MIDRRKVWSTLSDYPIYSPPFHDSEMVLSKKEIGANYDYFLEQKAARLDYLAKYLARFSIELRLAPETLPALDRGSTATAAISFPAEARSSVRCEITSRPGPATTTV